MSCAQTDHTFPPEFRNRAVAILDAAYKPYHLQLFSGVQHGFALRCDLNKPYEREWSLAGCARCCDGRADIRQVTARSRASRALLITLTFTSRRAEMVATFECELEVQLSSSLLSP